MTTTHPAPHHYTPRDGGLYRLKSLTARLLDTPVEAAVARGVSADTITWIGLGLSIIAAALILTGSLLTPVWWVAVLPVVLLRLGCAVADGQVARRSGSARPAGAVLGELTDRVGDVALAAALIPVAPVAAIIAMVAMLAADTVSAVGWAVTGQRTFAGIGGKPDRNILVGLGLLAAVCAPGVAAATVWGLASLAVTGTCLRIRGLASATTELTQEDPR